MLRALLLGVWYRLSDVKPESSLARDLLFRRFCGIRLEDRAPDHSTLSRFRTQLMAHGLLDQLYAVSPSAVHTVLEVVRATLELPLAAALKRGLALFYDTFDSHDFVEGRAVFQKLRR